MHLLALIDLKIDLLPFTCMVRSWITQSGLDLLRRTLLLEERKSGC